MHIIIDYDYKVLPEQLALEFCKLNAEEQARFFNTCTEEFERIGSFYSPMNISESMKEWLQNE